jgi:predicted flavoprotein YhiN
MARHFGQPLKGIRLTAGNLTSRGEVVIGAQGLEGGGLYPLTPALRQGAALVIDLFPDLTAAALAARMARAKPGDSRSNRLRKLGLTPAAVALVHETGATDLQALHLPARLRPLDEAISTAGGITRASLTDDLELRALPGTFAAGEMLDWDAPTGGYLLTACLATGRHAGRAAALHMGAGAR